MDENGAVKGDKEIRCTSPSFAIEDRAAVRYRWLRASPERALNVYMEWEGWQTEYRTPEKFDEEVDRMMADAP